MARCYAHVLALTRAFGFHVITAADAARGRTRQCPPLAAPVLARPGAVALGVVLVVARPGGVALGVVLVVARPGGVALSVVEVHVGGVVLFGHGVSLQSRGWLDRIRG